MKKLVFVFHDDAGHGWLAVKRELLIELGLLDKITSCSYQSKSGKTIYLEEDMDASIFMVEIKKLELKYEIKKGKYYHRSPIRNLPVFNK